MLKTRYSSPSTVGASSRPLKYTAQSVAGAADPRLSAPIRNEADADEGEGGVAVRMSTLVQILILIVFLLMVGLFVYAML